VPAPAPPGSAAFTLDSESSGRLEGLVTIRIVVHEPPGDNFFRIDILPNPKSERLRTVAKDMLFLVDCSASISQPKLSQFKQGVGTALRHLPPGDGFNVVSFRSKPLPLFETCQPVNAETVAAALRFLDRQERGGLTDVYNSLSPFVRAGADAAGGAYRPLNVFLLSDGRSTVRNRVDNDTFIREVVGLRQNHVSLYSFSAGSDANLFLMDLLAYCNRGGSIHVESLSRFAPQLAEFIRTHAEMIVADLRYRATGELARDIFPKQLPHLYRGETLSIYGRYPDTVDSLGLQIIGRDADGQEQELVFRCNLRAAPKGGPRLAVDWAAQKVYYLLAERALRPRPEISDEIRRLAEQYKLYVPYL
jgi:Ca-activated chloride channel family protein